ncbi:hypothetical protein SLS62_008528 [Diatrype stigma]|uniref:Uncharacterized protein n=1 Tax=Diatrype stigma TaxID=117547 RepID=A0AAN9YKE4_9PEZI
MSIGTPTSVPSSLWPSAAGDTMTISSKSSSVGPDDELLPLGYLNLLPGSQPGLLRWQGSSSLGTEQGQTGKQTAITTPYSAALDSSRSSNFSHAELSPFARSSAIVLPDLPPQQAPTRLASSQPQIEQVMQTNPRRACTSSSAAATAKTTLPAASPAASLPTWRSNSSSLTSPLQIPAEQRPLQHLSHRQQRLRPAKRASPNYRGDPSNPNNQSADIPLDQSTSVFIEGLPADCTVRDLVGGGSGGGAGSFITSMPSDSKSDFSSDDDDSGASRPGNPPALLRGTGKIYALSVAGPKPQAGIHTSCAKLVYWDRSGVDRLFEKLARPRGGGGEDSGFEGGDGAAAAGPGGLFFIARGGQRFRPVVKMNRYKTAPQAASERSRVVVVEGPSGVVNEARLTAFFAAFFTWAVDDVLVRWRRGGRARLEYRFASHRAQASEAFRRLVQVRAGALSVPGVEGEGEGGLVVPVEQWARERALERRLWSQITVSWGLDPCDPDSYPDEEE